MNRNPLLHGVLKAGGRRAGSGKAPGLPAKLRRSLLAGTALAGFVIGGVTVAPQQAMADCQVLVAGVLVECDGGGQQQSITPFTATNDWQYVIEDNTEVVRTAGGPVIEINAANFDGLVFIEEGSGIRAIVGDGAGGARNPLVVDNAGIVIFDIAGYVDSTQAAQNAQPPDAIRVTGGAQGAIFKLKSTAAITGMDDGIAIVGVDARLDNANPGNFIPGFVFINNAGLVSGAGEDASGTAITGDGIQITAVNNDFSGGNPVAALINILNKGTISGADEDTGADSSGYGIRISNRVNTVIQNYDGGIVQGGLDGIRFDNGQEGGIVLVENFGVTPNPGAPSTIYGEIDGIRILGSSAPGDVNLMGVNNYSPTPIVANVFFGGQPSLLNLIGNPEGTFHSVVRNIGGSLIEGEWGDGVDITNGGNVLVQNYGSQILGGNRGVEIDYSFDNDPDDERTYAIVVNSGGSLGQTVTIIDEDGNPVEVNLPVSSGGIIHGEADAVLIRGTGSGIPIGFTIPFITGVDRGGHGGGYADIMWNDSKKVAFNTVVINFNAGTMWGDDGDAVDIENGGRVLVVNSGPGSLMRGSDDSGVEITTTSDDSINNDRYGYAIVWNRMNAEIRGREDGVYINQIGRHGFLEGGEFFTIEHQFGSRDYTVAVVNTDSSVIRSRRGDAVDIENTRGAVFVNNQVNDSSGNSWLMGRDSGIEIETVRGRNIDAEGWVGGFVTVLSGNLDGPGYAIVTGRGSRNNPVINIDDVRGLDPSSLGVGVRIVNGPRGIMGSRNLPGMPSVRSSVTPIEDLLAGRDVDVADSEIYQFIKDQSLFQAFRQSLGGGWSWGLAEKVKDLMPDYRRAARDRLARIRDIERGNILFVNQGFMAGRVNLESERDLSLNGFTVNLSNDNGIWFTRGRNIFDEPGGNNNSIVSNLGGWIQTALNPDRRERTWFDGLDLFNNQGGLISMMDHAPGDRTFTTGDYDAQEEDGGHGFLGVDVYFGQPRDEVDSWSVAGRSDRFRVGGDIDGGTGIIVQKTNDVPGGINQEGIRVVRYGGDNLGNECFNALCDSSNTFYISELSQDYFAISGVGFVQDGFFAVGLTEIPTGSGDFLFVSDWAPQAHQMPSLISGAQNIWYESTSVVSDHIYGNLFPRMTAAPADDRVVKGAVPAPQRTSALWIKATGAWTDRDASTKATNWGGTDTTVTMNTSYKQDTYNIIAGIDGGGASGSGVWRGGLFGGYTSSGLRFDFGGAKADYDGWLVGGYLAYVQGGGYADVMVRADFLDLDYKAPFGKKGTDAQSIGVMANLGHRTDSGSAFFEPIVSFAYVNTDVGNFTLGGANVRFGDGTSLRLGGGARVGASMASGGHVAEFSLLAKLWNEFHNNKVRLTDIQSGTTATFSDDAKGLFGEVMGTATVYSTDRSLSGFLSAGAKFNGDFLTLTAKAGLRRAF